jgi:hypothetical protein
MIGGLVLFVFVVTCWVAFGISQEVWDEVFFTSMAALSSLSGSRTKTVRITYQELLEFADDLDNEKKKKSPKRKSKENAEEKGSKSSVSPSKNEKSRDNDEKGSETVCDKKTGSQKTERKSKEEKRSSKKKDDEKKKHRDRSHSDENPSQLGQEKQQNKAKDKRDKTTKVRKTEECPSDTSNIEDADSQKAKEEKKSHRKRSPRSRERSGELTAVLEDHVAKVQLDDHGGEGKGDTESLEEDSHKRAKSSKKKTKSNEEKEKKSLESRKKAKKKSADVEANKEISQEDIHVGKEKEKEKSLQKKVRIVNDDSEIQDEHKKHGGIIKSSSKLKANHVHVSFSVETTDSHTSGTNSVSKNEERGIIRIPEGIDIHQEDFKMVNNVEDSLGKQNEEADEYYDAYYVDDIDVEYHQNESHGVLQAAVESENRSKCNEYPEVETSEEGGAKMNNMEKRLKALNRQRAQQLMKHCHHAETSLSNLLSKGITDKGSLNKVCTLSKEIRDSYQGVIMLDPGFANQQDVDQMLWRNAFYQVIETFRKYGKLFLGYSNQNNVK